MSQPIRIPVNRPYLPAVPETLRVVEQVFESGWITNDGPKVNQLEAVLSSKSRTAIRLVSSGTLGLQLAIKALGLKRVITTPFSYIATLNSLLWEGCDVVFADIDPRTWNVTTDSIRKVYETDIDGVLLTHVFGNPCDLYGIQTLCQELDLKLLYDAAHCVGVEYDNQSILSFGDASVISLHATKVIHTIEGGAVFSKSEELIDRIGLMRNFGHSGQYKFDGIGINAKMSELNASIGLLTAAMLDEIIAARSKINQVYTNELNKLPVIFQDLNPLCTKYNHSYSPMVLNSEDVCIALSSYLRNKGIETRRYFYPSLNRTVKPTFSNVPVSESISERILCLPNYYSLTDEMQSEVVSEVKNFFR